MANIVFSDKQKLKKLNELSHPIVFRKVDEIYRENEGKNLYIEVSAFDLNMAEYFDEIIYVKSSKGNRVERIKARNNFEESYILSIMSNQLSEEEMEKVADFVIVNDGWIGELEEQVGYIVTWLN